MLARGLGQGFLDLLRFVFFFYYEVKSGGEKKAVSSGGGVNGKSANPRLSLGAGFRRDGYEGGVDRLSFIPLDN